MHSILNYSKLPSLSGIYVIIDTLSGKYYIGSAVNIKKRICNHVYKFKRNIHSNPHMQSIWNKNPNRFICNTLKFVETDKLLQAEQSFIDVAMLAEKNGKNQECMNVLIIANSHFGRKRSKETIEKLKKINLGRIPNEETRMKMRMAKLGKKQSPETILKRTMNQKGENNNLAKLKQHEAYEVKYSKIPLKQLAEKYGMSVSGLEKIRYGKTWKTI